MVCDGGRLEAGGMLAVLFRLVGFLEGMGCPSVQHTLSVSSRSIGNKKTTTLMISITDRQTIGLTLYKKSLGKKCPPLTRRIKLQRPVCVPVVAL